MTKDLIPITEECAAGCGSPRKPKSSRPGSRELFTCGSELCLAKCRKEGGARKLLEARYGVAMVAVATVAAEPHADGGMLEKRIQRAVNRGDRECLNFDGASDRARRLGVPQEGPFRVREATDV